MMTPWGMTYCRRLGGVQRARLAGYQPGFYRKEVRTMPPYGWKFGRRWHGYYVETEISRENVEAAVKALLVKARKGETWTSPCCGVRHFPILVDTNIVGHLWEDVDLSALEVSAFWSGPFGVKAELASQGRVVGMVWVNIE